jgi:AhpD family alkylhydroperoxidase
MSSSSCAASQINRCAHCLDKHSKDARALGEDEQRLHVLGGWREAPPFTARERAALGRCEALTLLPQTGAPDDVYARSRRSSHRGDRGADVRLRRDQRLEPPAGIGAAPGGHGVLAVSSSLET